MSGEKRVRSLTQRAFRSRASMSRHGSCTSQMCHFKSSRKARRCASAPQHPLECGGDAVRHATGSGRLQRGGHPRRATPFITTWRSRGNRTGPSAAPSDLDGPNIATAHAPRAAAVQHSRRNIRGQAFAASDVRCVLQGAEGQRRGRRRVAVHHVEWEDAVARGKLQHPQLRKARHVESCSELKFVRPGAARQKRKCVEFCVAAGARCHLQRV
jgi:hypothetical protein